MALYKALSSPAGVHMAVHFSNSSPGNMFNEDEDWNDEGDAQILSKTVLSNTKKTDRGTSAKVHADSNFNNNQT